MVFHFAYLDLPFDQQIPVDVQISSYFLQLSFLFNVKEKFPINILFFINIQV